MPEKNQAQKDMANFAHNLKTTSLGVNFSKALFTDPSRLSPKQIVNTLKALGMNIPAEVDVAADAAQIIVAGQAINQALEAGKTLEDVKSLTTATGTSVRAINMIAAKNGWFDQDTVSVVSYATNVGMIIASAGSNVAAWIGLAMDVASTVSAKQAEADINALKDAQRKFSSMLTGQTKILGETFKDFQNGSIGIYGVIAKMAVETPALWPQVVNKDSPFVQMFPELMMIPTIQESITGYGESAIKGNYPWPASGSWIIESWNSHKSISYTSINKMSKEDAAEYFFTILLKPWIWCYSIANDEIVGRGNMSMENVAALSYMVNPEGEISDRDDYVNMLLGANLTPYDFGDVQFDDIAQQFVRDMYKGQDTKFHESAISFGLNPANAGFRALTRDQEIMRQRLEAVKKTASIWELVQYPYFYKRLQSYMDFEQVSFEKDPTFGGKINEKFPEKSTRAWRKLHNYISVMHLMGQFRDDSYLKTTRFAESLAPFIPSVDKFDAKVKRINYLSTMRSVNQLALKRVAELLGVNASQLVKETPDDFIGAAKFTIK